MTNSLCKQITSCRACKNSSFVSVLDLGKTPPANSFLETIDKRAPDKEFWFPLKVLLCKNCSLLQLKHVVSPKLLFDNYVYVSSTNKAFTKHFKDFSENVVAMLTLKKGNLIIDIGSNDGILLKPFKSQGMRVLGIEPAKDIAKRANQNGIKTIQKFFSPKLAKAIVKKYGPAKVVTANNVFAHIDDLDKVIIGVKILLEDDGVFIIEVPYLVDFLRKNLFDTVYHEHLSYFAIHPLKGLFERLGMKIFAVRKVRSHGGSIRVFVKKNSRKYKVNSSVSRYIGLERELKLHTLIPYRLLSKRIENNKKKLKNLLLSLKRQRKQIVGYGAPAKGNTLLNYFGISKRVLDYIVDDSVYKQGLYTPGTHIPVVAPRALYRDQPDYILILAWNFAQPIMKTHQEYKRLGGAFIIPVPYPKII